MLLIVADTTPLYFDSQGKDYGEETMVSWE